MNSPSSSFKKELADRRKILLNKVGRNNAAILFSSKMKIRNGDVNFPFRQESDFYYYTGFPEPDAVALFLPGRLEGEFILFNQPRNPNLEKWVGHRVGQENACTQFDVDQAFDIAQLNEKIIELLANRETLYYPLGKNCHWDKRVISWMKKLKTAYRRGSCVPKHLADLSYITAEMRLFKTKNEIINLKKACEISALAHKKLMQACQPGMYEYELQALFEYEIKRKGCHSTAYQSIVGGGENACILHYVENKAQLVKDTLVLIDAGGEYQNYAADITRTFPVNGKFTKDQAVVYQLVLDTQLTIIKLIKPGVRWSDLQETAVKVLTKGMVDLGIIPHSFEEALEKKSYQEYYMHSIGHWIGLDVHDVGDCQEKGKSRLLQEGMVLTVEPGLYLSPNVNLDKRWWNIGIRIEDVALVTAKGCEILTHQVPKTIDEIESLMAENFSKQ